MHHTLHRIGNRNRTATFSGRSSRLYDTLARRLLRRVYRRLAADVALLAPQGAALLDAGTGPGVLLLELAARRPDLRLSGIDLSSDMVDAARRNLQRAGRQVTVQVGDVANLPFADGSFDLVVSSLSMHHWERLDSAAQELARVLRPGGQLHIYDMPFAPFDEFVAGTPAASLFTGQEPERTDVRIRFPLLPALVRLTMSVPVR